jgi:hypothetical protein
LAGAEPEDHVFKVADGRGAGVWQEGTGEGMEWAAGEAEEEAEGKENGEEGGEGGAGGGGEDVAGGRKDEMKTLKRTLMELMINLVHR